MAFLLNTLCVWIGLLLLTLPACLSISDFVPTSARSLANWVVTVLLIALSLTALSA